MGSPELPEPALLKQEQFIPVHISSLREESSNPLVFNVFVFILLFLEPTFLPNLILAYFQRQRTSFSVARTGFNYILVPWWIYVEERQEILFFTAVILFFSGFSLGSIKKCGVWSAPDYVWKGRECSTFLSTPFLGTLFISWSTEVLTCSVSDSSQLLRNSQCCNASHAMLGA